MSTDRRDFADFIKMLATEIFGRHTTLTLTGAYTIPANANVVQMLDNGGSARNVTLPDEASHRGKFLFVYSTNAGAVAITFLGSGGGALTPATTIAARKGVLLFCDGVAWFPILAGA